jgi:transketolase
LLSSLVKDGNNLEEIDNAITKAKQQNGPTLIEVKTIIGYGAPNVSGTNGSSKLLPSFTKIWFHP